MNVMVTVRLTTIITDYVGMIGINSPKNRSVIDTQENSEATKEDNEFQIHTPLFIRFIA